MNKSILSLFIIAGTLLFGACNKSKMGCANLPKTALYFTTGSGSVLISYSSYKIDAFAQGSGLKKTDTSFLVNCGELVKDVAVKITHPYLSSAFDKHDWVITFYPSGKRFKILNAARSYRKEAAVRSQLQEGVKCYNGFSFLLNDSAKVSSNSDVLIQPDYEYVYIQY